MKPEKSQEENNPLDPQTIFKISEAEIRATGKTQCVKHTWKKLSDNEVVCGCGTAIIVSDIKDYV